MSLAHFKVLRSIGRGAFGKVCVVRKRDTGTLFAMKYMSKARLHEAHAASAVVNECRILRTVRHAFLVNLCYAFQDEEDVFFVVDLMLGGDLRFHLRRAGPFGEASVRLYAAELASGLAYLHRRGIIHRDVKPDNILLDARGHAHLADFGVAVVAATGADAAGRAGTKPYMGGWAACRWRDRARAR